MNRTGGEGGHKDNVGALEREKCCPSRESNKKLSSKSHSKKSVKKKLIE